MCMRIRFNVTVLITISLISLTAKAYSGKIVDNNGEPVTGAGIYGLTADSIFVCSTVSDSIGCFALEKHNDINLICIRSLGCVDQFITPESDHIGTVAMIVRPHELNEVIVKQDSVQRLADRTIYRLSKEQLNKYTTVFGALNEIPHMFTSYDGRILYKGYNNVTVLINGMVASYQEIMQLSKSDIARIEIYDIPPVRFLMSGATCVIDIITKEDITGGNAGVSIKDAIWRVDSDNSIWGIYNYKRSRFNVEYINSIKHYRKYRFDESLYYKIDGMEYGKDKIGNDSPNNNDTHSISVGFMNRKAKDYQFNASVSYSNDKTDNNKFQTVKYRDGVVSDASNHLKTGYDKYALNLYFNKTQKNGNEFMANVVGTGYSTNFYSKSLETMSDGSIRFESLSQYSGQQYSMLGQMSYMINSHIGAFTLNGSGLYLHSSRNQADQLGRSHRLSAQAYAKYFNHLNNLYCSVILSGQYSKANTDAASVNKRYSRWNFSPMIALTYIPNQSIGVQLIYDRTMNNPTAAQLSEYTQWIDANYMFHGNSSLRPYVTDKISLHYSHEFPFINWSIYTAYKHISGFITNHFEYAGDKILETIVNLDKYHEITGQLDLTIFLLRNRSLYFSSRVVGGRTWGKGTNYDWKGYRFQFMPNITLNLKRWLFQIGYQYPGKYVEGHLVRPRGECIKLYGEYRPVNNMSIGLEWFQPFCKYFKDGEHTVPESIVQTKSIGILRDWGNIVRLSFRYNIDFGRKQDNSRQRLNYTDTDSGILTK